MNNVTYGKTIGMVFCFVLFQMVSFCGLSAPAANAHFSTTGYSEITIEGHTVNYILDLDPQEVGQWVDLNSGKKTFVIDPNASAKTDSKGFRWEKEELERMVTRFLSVKNNHVPGKAELTEIGSTKRGDAELVRLNVMFRFDRPVEQYEVVYNLFFDDLDPKHQNFALLHAGAAATEHVFEQGSRVLSGNAAAVGNNKEAAHTGVPETLRTYTWMGMKHIWQGYDHLLFLLGLVILKQAKRDYLKMLTAFTLGHSITLALSALNMFTISLKIIEPLIALSIVYIAAENIWLKRSQRRWAIALLFGLVHGFGFAHILRGTLGNHFVLSLVSFNAGVEIGQVAVLVLLLPLLWLMGRVVWYPALARSLSGAIGCLGLFWLIQRIVLI